MLASQVARIQYLVWLQCDLYFASSSILSFANTREVWSYIILRWDALGDGRDWIGGFGAFLVLWHNHLGQFGVLSFAGVLLAPLPPHSQGDSASKAKSTADQLNCRTPQEHPGRYPIPGPQKLSKRMTRRTSMAASQMQSHLWKRRGRLPQSTTVRPTPWINQTPPAVRSSYRIEYGPYVL